jgi:hypothetical protein
MNPNNYLVHSHHKTSVEVDAKSTDGFDIKGTMPASIVELTPQDGQGATITLTLKTPLPQDVADMEALYPVGGVVQLLGFKLIAPPASPAAAA